MLPAVAAIGAIIVLALSLIASQMVAEQLVQFDWPIAVYVGILIVVGYGPSVWWIWFASKRWGTGRVLRDIGVAARWSDLGWGPLIWLTAIASELLVVVIIEMFDIPLIGNLEGVGELDLDRTYVISMLVTAVIAAPLVEEALFRGVILRGFLSRMGPVFAVGAQGVIFGAVHADPSRGTGNIGLVMVLGAVGIAFGGAAYFLRRIGPTILAHAIFNAVVMAVVLND